MARPSRSPLWILLLLAVAPSRSEAQGHRLNGPLAPSGEWGDAQDHAVDPSGSWIVYRAEGEVFRRSELYSVPADGSSPERKLNGAIVAGGDVARDYAIAPGGDRVVYRSEGLLLGRFELHSAPIDGSTAPVPLSETGTSVQGFRISPDGSTVLAFAGRSSGPELFQVPVDGSEEPTRLNQPLQGGTIEDAWITPDGTFAVYLSDEDELGAIELRAVPLDASTPSIQRSPDLAVDEGVHQVGFSPDGSQLVFLADPLGPGRVELFRAPVVGDQPISLVQVDPDEEIRRFWLSPDGAVVVFVADLDVDDVFELFRVPLGGGAATKLSGPTAGDVRSDPDAVAFDASGSRVLYLADQDTAGVLELYGVPLDGGAPAERLHAALAAGAGVQEFRVHPATPLVAFLMVPSPGSAAGVFAVPADGGSAPVALDASLPPGGPAEALSLSADGTRAAFLRTSALLQREAFGVPLDASGPPARLHGDLPPGGSVLDVAIHVGDLAVHRGDERFQGLVELFAGPADGSVPATPIHGDLYEDSVVGDVSSARALPSGLAFYAASEQSPAVELYTVPIREDAVATRRNGPLGVGEIEDYLLTPDLATLVIQFHASDQGPYELLRTPVAGVGAPELLLSLPSAPSLLGPTPDGTRLLYVVDDTTWIVPLDGAGPPLVVTEERLEERTFVPPLVTPDGQTLLYLADPDPHDVHAASTDGLQTIRRLTSLAFAEHVLELRLTPDGARVVVEVENADGGSDLYAAPVDGSQAAVRLHPSMVQTSVRIGGWAIAPDSGTVVFTARLDLVGVTELYAAPPDGSAPPVKLSQPMVAGGDVRDEPLLVSEDSQVVTYRADAITNGANELFRAPLAGGGPHLRLNGPLVLGGGVGERVLSGREGRVVYTADALVDNVHELFSVPPDGSGVATRLNAPLATGQAVRLDFALTPDGGTVVYRSDEDLPGTAGLFAVPITGWRAPRKLSQPLDPMGDVLSFEIAPDGRRVLYLADETDMVQELFFSYLQRPSHQAGGLPPLRSGGDF